MIKMNRKKIWLFTLLIISSSIFNISVNAQKTENAPTNTTQWNNDDLKVDSFSILPELSEEEINDVNEKVNTIGQAGWHVWDTYNGVADDPSFTTSKQIASWIMNRDTLLNYLKFIVKFLSQLWLVVWTWFIIYAGYKYMLSVFNWGKWASSEPIKNAIIGIIIVVFSYAIMKTLTSLVWIT